MRRIARSSKSCQKMILRRPPVAARPPLRSQSLGRPRDQSKIKLVRNQDLLRRALVRAGRIDLLPICSDLLVHRRRRGRKTSSGSTESARYPVRNIFLLPTFSIILERFVSHAHASIPPSPSRPPHPAASE